MMSSSVADLFKTLDGPFVNFKEKVEPIVWHGKDVVISQVFELKIPALAGSIVKYSFHTSGGDIEFSSSFAITNDETIVADRTRIPSDKETINGTFKSVRDGTFKLIFDNGFSWFNTKTLTYKISLYQPVFTVADANRCTKSRRLLASTIEHIKDAKVKILNSEDEKKNIESDISVLESRLKALKVEMEQKQAVLQNAEKEVVSMTSLIKANEQKKIGLCIRCLDYKLLAEVLSYLGPDVNGAYMTCKYWKVNLDHFLLKEQKRKEQKQQAQIAN